MSLWLPAASQQTGLTRFDQFSIFLVLVLILNFLPPDLSTMVPLGAGWIGLDFLTRLLQNRFFGFVFTFGIPLKHVSANNHGGGGNF
jgi:hypothetical protein